MKPISRKFLLCLLIVVLSFMFRALGMIDCGALVALVLGTAGGYITGNLLDKKENGNG